RPDKRAKEGCAQTTEDEKQDKEQRHLRQRRPVREERLPVEADAARDEEDRDEETEPRLIELLVEVGVGHHPVAVCKLEDGAGEESAQDRFQAEALRDDAEEDQE